MVALKDAVVQWSNLGSLIHALHSSNYDLIGQSLQDVIVEPHRSKLIPNYFKLKQIASDHGALGTSISGSGPSIFSLCKGSKTARSVEANLINFMNETNLPFESYLSKINTQGVKILP